jgi:hypothetical protein
VGTVDCPAGTKTYKADSLTGIQSTTCDYDDRSLSTDLRHP